MIVPLIFLVALTASLQADIKILDTPSHKTGPDPCARICSGVTWWDDTGFSKWIESRFYKNKLIKGNDLSKCGFVAAPLITATTGGRASNLCPSVPVSFVSKGRFDLYTVEDASLREMEKRECSIYWTASGYTC